MHCISISTLLDDLLTSICLVEQHTATMEKELQFLVYAVHIHAYTDNRKDTRIRKTTEYGNAT